MTLLSKTLTVSICCFALISVTGATKQCENGTMQWTCKDDEKCKQQYEQCEKSTDSTWAAIIAKLFVFWMVVLGLGKCCSVCRDCRCPKVERENDAVSTNIYQVVANNDTIVSVDDASPPSYEEAMNNSNPHRFESLR